ncbi:rodlin [Streptomyces sp. 4N509B]|uniref:rodlin n=1 Tax=Streptomyces sp. 4N509B TaxID=3457413 RepID=UPI003FD527D6
MIKKTLATVVVAASAVGVTGVAATPALAIGGDETEAVKNALGAKEAIGNTTTGGYMSPNISLINGSLNRVCLGLDDIDAGVLQLVGVYDLLNNKPKNSCSDNSTATSGDSPLSHILSDLSVLSENGVSKH